jgi:hypothetical protein
LAERNDAHLPFPVSGRLDERNVIIITPRDRLKCLTRMKSLATNRNGSVRAEIDPTGESVSVRESGGWIAFIIAISVTRQRQPRTGDAPLMKRKKLLSELGYDDALADEDDDRKSGQDKERKGDEQQRDHSNHNGFRKRAHTMGALRSVTVP